MSVEVTTNNVPDRLNDQDEAVMVIVFRRTDVPAEDGSPSPDITAFDGPPDPAFIDAIVAFCIASGFDPSQSFATIASLTDVEQGGAATLSDLQALGA